MTVRRMPLGPSPSGDTGRGLIRLAPADLAALGVRPGDIVAIDGARRTHARVLPGSGDAGRLGAERTVAENAGAAWGTAVAIAAAPLPPLAKLRLRAEGRVPGDLGDRLRDMALTEGDRLAFPGAAGSYSLIVAATVPAPAGRVVEDTAVTVDRDEERPFPGLGGLREQIASVRECVELPLQRPDLFERLGLPPPRGILLVGPPGTGKTALARAIAERGGLTFLSIAGPEIVSKHYGETEKALRAVFEEASRRAPAIVFLDEIDAIAPRRAALSGEKQVERRVVGQLLTLMDGLSSRERVIVLAATNLADALDPALRRPGRFDREIVFGTPSPEERDDILRVHLAAAPLAADADPAGVAARAHGYTGADLAALAREAALAALMRAQEAAGSVDALDAAALEIGAADLEAGFARTRPSVLSADLNASPPVRWEDVGGLDTAKAALTEAVIWPSRHPGAVHRLGLTPPRGILLVGPPGGGKTLLARALATEAGMSLIPGRPAQLLSQHLGEAERAVADLFARARAGAPCLVFFDELDALAPPRGAAGAALDRVLAQLLTEMDGLEDNTGVTVLAATNRADGIDPALTRPGRFDLVLPIGLPDRAARGEILAVHAAGRALGPDADLAAVAAVTEGWSGAALAGLMAGAARAALARAVAEGCADDGAVAICAADLEQARLSGDQQDAARSGRPTASLAKTGVARP